MVNTELMKKINEQTSIVDLVSEYVKLEKRGKNLFGLCPFHDDSDPSFSVSPEKNIAKCMSCGEGGMPITFYSKIKKISIDEAARFLADKAGIKVDLKPIKKDPFEKDYLLLEEATRFYQFNLKQSEQGKDALKYVTRRIEKESDIDYFKIGFARQDIDSVYSLLKDKGYAVSDMVRLGLVKQNDKGEYYDLFRSRIIFPITNENGRVVGFSGRAIDKNEKAKYINSPETNVFKKGKLLYNLYEASSEIRKEKHLVLYEGFFDVIASHQAGIKNVVATMGTALTRDHALLIKKHTNSIILGFDGDDAGLKASLQSIATLEKEGLKLDVLIIPEKMDPDEFVNAYGAEQFEKLFGENLKDSYQFRYDFYKKGKNLSNANDVQEFKTNIIRMIKNADPSVASLYRQRLAKELNIEIETIKSIPQPTNTKKTDLPKKEKPKSNIINQKEKAEWIFFYGISRSKKIFNEYKKSLKTDDYVNHLSVIIRFKLEDYFDKYDTFDPNLFRLQLKDENEIEHFDIALKENFHWDLKKEISEEEIENAIVWIKKAADERRIEYLMQKTKENNSLSGLEAKELLDLVRKNNIKK